MKPFWIAQLLNVAIVLAFGCFLIWRSRREYQKRLVALQQSGLDTAEKEQRVAFLREEIDRLRSESGETGNAIDKARSLHCGVTAAEALLRGKLTASIRSAKHFQTTKVRVCRNCKDPGLSAGPDSPSRVRWPLPQSGQPPCHPTRKVRPRKAYLLRDNSRYGLSR